MYCMNCGGEVVRESLHPFGGHFLPISEEEALVYWCNGPYTTCPPPPFPEHWEDTEEPSTEEMELINAEEILISV